MRSHLGLADLTVLGCLLAAACAPIDGDDERPANQDRFDADLGDAQGNGDSEDEGDGELLDADTPPYDAEPFDGGADDAASPAMIPADARTPEPDAGMTDAGISKPDAGIPKPDAGAPEPDAGAPKPDAGTPKPDAGAPKPDAGTPKPDAGTLKPDAGTPSTTTFTQVYAIISVKCAFCHVADHIGFSLGHLDMSTKAAAYSNLVGQAAKGIDCGGTGHVRVVAGRPEQSLIIHKLLGTADCGVQMPDNFPPLSSAQVEVFRSWIKAGAKND